MRLTIFVPGNPVPKGRPRFGRGRTYTPARTRAYESKVSQAAQEALQRAGLGRYGGRVSVAVSAVLAVPKSYTRAQRVDAVNGYSYPSGDLDNYAKVMDGLNRIVWEDDRQIVQMSAIKRWARQGEQEGLTIEVVHLDDQP